MKIENGKIVEATESELFDRWLSCDHCEIYPFQYYKWLCQDAGAKIVNDAAENSQCSDKAKHICNVSKETEVKE